MATNSAQQFTNDVPTSRLKLTETDVDKRAEWRAICQDIRAGALPLRELTAFVWYLLTTKHANRPGADG